MLTANLKELLEKLPESITVEGRFLSNELFVNGKKLSLQRSLKVRNHSPTGFNWGYGGSGPAQSALAILLEYWDPQTAQTYYQDFKWKYIAPLPQTSFTKEVPLRAILYDIIRNNLKNETT